MPSIKYLGPTTDDIDVLNRLRLQTEVSGTLTPALVDQQITTSLSTKANSYYLGNKSGQYVSPSAMSGRGDALINKSTQVGGPGQPVVMQGGRIPASYLPRTYDRPGGKSWRMVTEYSNANLSITTGVWNSNTERQIGSFSVSGPNYPWFPIFSGDFNIGGGKGEVCIKQGSRYIARAINGNDANFWWTCNVIPTASLTSYTGSINFQITQRAFWEGTNLGAGFRLTCLAIPA